MKPPRVLVLGNTTLDHVFRLPDGLVADAKVQSQDYAACAGGQAANVAVTLALCGLPVQFVGAFGDDAGAQLSRSAFAAAGVELALSTTLHDCAHYTACVLVSRSQRSIVMYRDPRLVLATPLSERALAGCAAAYSDGHEGDASLQLAALAAQCGIPLVLDIEVVNAQTTALAACAAHLIAPAAVVQQLAQCDDLAEALRTLARRGPLAVVATRGEHGAAAVLRGEDTVLQVATQAQAVIDTTGAGDAFHAGYLLALLRGDTLPQRLTLAGALAAAKCALAGPRLDAQSCTRFSWSAPP